MRFEFCGNVDCPEWVLAEVALLNRISAVKLKLILVQIVKKITGQPFDNEKIIKLCRDQKFDTEETHVFTAIVEFLLRQSIKH
jgi:selenocysteine lyase/cysteine desulfurase